MECCSRLAVTEKLMGVADGDRKQRKAMGLLRLGNPRMNIPDQQGHSLLNDTVALRPSTRGNLSGLPPSLLALAWV